jgi:hypothetical protein
MCGQGRLKILFQFKVTKSLLGRQELAAQMLDARQWCSFFKRLGSWPGRGLGQKLLLCV